jgi:predicted patatin/cPLA2 family phospholipase
MKEQNKMHPVIEHLLERKNKKIPVKDGRKIALVLFGGAMAGIRGAGAMVALHELGLANAFDEMYTASAGFCNASYLLSGNPAEGTTIYYENLCGNQFINYLKPWRMVNIDHMINCAQNLKPLNIKKILASKTKLYARVDNISKNEESFLEAHDFPSKKYFELMRATTVIPYLSPGTVKIGHYKYKDIITDDGWVNLLFDVLSSDLTDVLIIYNTPTQYRHIHKKVVTSLNKERVYEILPKASWKLSKLETNSKIIKQAAIQMGNFTKNIFGSKKPISLKYTK